MFLVVDGALNGSEMYPEYLEHPTTGLSGIVPGDAGFPWDSGWTRSTGSINKFSFLWMNLRVVIVVGPVEMWKEGTSSSNLLRKKGVKPSPAEIPGKGIQVLGKNFLPKCLRISREEIPDFSKWSHCAATYGLGLKYRPYMGVVKRRDFRVIAPFSPEKRPSPQFYAGYPQKMSERLKLAEKSIPRK
jgi:hypothetical protein